MPPLVPLVRDVLADVETPLSVYWKLAHDEPHSFLLESVTGGEQLARYSFIGVRPRAVLFARADSLTTVEGPTKSTEALDGRDPLRVVQSRMAELTPEAVEGLPHFCGGAVGTIGYDYARRIERLPAQAHDDLGLDDVAMMLTETVVAFDHAKNLIRVIVLAEDSVAGRDRGNAEIERVLARLREPLPPLPHGRFSVHEPRANQTREQFEASVERVIDLIGQGDAIQVVPSLRFSVPIDAHPVSLYRSLRSLNPSPYMFLLRFGAFDVVGASPEILVGLHGRTARVRPIAGTRPRSANPTEDAALAEELLADEKERAEHIMLVDLGRNDLGRVCEYGSVRVGELMVVERYSHVMHIVSDVTGRLREGLDGIDLIRAGFPAGTVSGAPKVRAMQIIDELEPTRRGLYAGGAGYLSATGDVDLAIAIRTILIKDGLAHVQAGAGIVYDSVPEREYEECLNKARAALKAVRLAQTGEMM